MGWQATGNQRQVSSRVNVGHLTEWNKGREQGTELRYPARRSRYLPCAERGAGLADDLGEPRISENEERTDYPNSPMTGLPVENGGRMMPVFLLMSFSGTPRAWRTVAWRSCGVTGLLFGADAVLSDSP
jgi:hypothetical protein